MYLWLFWIPVQLISLLLFIEFICTWRQLARIIWYFKNKPSWLLGELKLASKTNQFWAQNNVNMEWIQKQSVKCTYTSKPQMSSPVPNWNPFQHTSACINVLYIFHCFSSNKCNSWTNTHQYEYGCQLNCRKLN